jgi:RND superfamily putative drug exporter
MMLFTVLFGLSMDYEVFLLSRVREEYLVSGDNATAVADGLASTARVITAAAAIMIAVFMSFVLGDLRVLKLLGLGLATAIFIDASVVRMVLVPATMELLGKANWWFPKWLDRIVPRVSVEAPAVLAREEAVPLAVATLAEDATPEMATPPELPAPAKTRPATRTPAKTTARQAKAPARRTATKKAPARTVTKKTAPRKKTPATKARTRASAKKAR